MKRVASLIITVLVSLSVFGQEYLKTDGTNYMKAGLSIKRDSYLGNWFEMVSTNPDYTPNQYWKWWIEGEGLKLSRSHNGSTWTKLLRFDDEESIVEFDLEKIRLNGKVGIGVANPESELEVKGNITIKTEAASASYADFSIERSNGGQLHMGVSSNSINSFISSTGRLSFINNGTKNLNILQDGKVGIGTTSPSATLDVSGNIKAHEIEVTLASIDNMELNGTLAANNITVTANGQTADFVFAPDYELKNLEEVEAYIKEHNHLPDVPSAQDMEANGVNLAEMNKLLLQKVEELTLYSIQQEEKLKDVDALIMENEGLKSAVKDMKSDLEAIKAVLKGGNVN